MAPGRARAAGACGRIHRRVGVQRWHWRPGALGALDIVDPTVLE